MAANGFALAELLEEIIDYILRDDWFSDATRDGRTYYVLGADAYYWDKSEIPTEERRPKWIPKPDADRYMRAIIAGGGHPDYLQVAEKRLNEAGISSKEEAAKIMKRLIKERGYAEELPGDQIEAVCYWLDASLSSALEEVSPSTYPRPEVYEEDRQKLYLRELAHKYRALLKKLNRLTPLPFQDSQLQEATRCWLYGFYRATIIVAASALEARLKEAIGETWLDTYRDLVDTALAQGKLEPPYDQKAKDVFCKRRQVAHEGNTFDPSSRDAEEVLIWVRGILTKMHE